MQLGMIGLGRMGASMVWPLLGDGHACVVHDVQPAAVAGLVKDGATGAASLKQIVSQLGQPRTIWLMVPAAAVDRALADLLPLPLLSAALFERFASRGNADFASRLLTAMRYEFGGHVEKPAP